jgi:hypothetical protein
MKSSTLEDIILVNITNALTSADVEILQNNLRSLVSRMVAKWKEGEFTTEAGNMDEDDDENKGGLSSYQIYISDEEQADTFDASILK